VRVMSARVNLRPRPWIEIGVSRTAQWCGGDRECGFGTFTDMLLGRDNAVVEGQPTQDQPGNQMAGYDLRLRSPWRRLPLAFYSQWIGEDEAGGLPSKFIALFGLESWGSLWNRGWRLRAEYTDTACSFSRQAPEFDCAYRNTIYPEGYSYRGRIIGHSLDNDGRMYSVNGSLVGETGQALSMTVRRIEVNRNGGRHAISAVPIALDNVELRYSRGFGAGMVSVGTSYSSSPVPGAFDSRFRAFAVWQQGF
jgi:hypothetical protein